MITKFSEEEINYIEKNFNELLNNDDKLYSDIRKQIGTEELNTVKEMLKNIEKINDDEEYNKKLISTIYWDLNMWCFHQRDYDAEELTEMLNDEIYGQIYNKVINSD